MKKRGRVTFGALALAATLVVSTATTASADVAGPFDSLKACEKGRVVARSNGWTVGPCQKTKPVGFYIFYMERL